MQMLAQQNQRQSASSSTLYQNYQKRKGWSTTYSTRGGRIRLNKTQRADANNSNFKSRFSQDLDSAQKRQQALKEKYNSNTDEFAVKFAQVISPKSGKIKRIGVSAQSRTPPVPTGNRKLSSQGKVMGANRMVMNNVDQQAAFGRSSPMHDMQVPAESSFFKQYLQGSVALDLSNTIIHHGSELLDHQTNLSPRTLNIQVSNTHFRNTLKMGEEINGEFNISQLDQSRYMAEPLEINQSTAEKDSPQRRRGQLPNFRPSVARQDYNMAKRIPSDSLTSRQPKAATNADVQSQLQSSVSGAHQSQLNEIDAFLAQLNQSQLSKIVSPNSSKAPEITLGHNYNLSHAQIQPGVIKTSASNHQSLHLKEAIEELDALHACLHSDSQIQGYCVQRTGSRLCLSIKEKLLFLLDQLPMSQRNPLASLALGSIQSGQNIYSGRSNLMETLQSREQRANIFSYHSMQNANNDQRIMQLEKQVRLITSKKERYKRMLKDKKIKANEDENTKLQNQINDLQKQVKFLQEQNAKIRQSNDSLDSRLEFSQSSLTGTKKNTSTAHLDQLLGQPNTNEQHNIVLDSRRDRNNRLSRTGNIPSKRDSVEDAQVYCDTVNKSKSSLHGPINNCHYQSMKLQAMNTQSRRVSGGGNTATSINTKYLKSMRSTSPRHSVLRRKARQIQDANEMFHMQPIPTSKENANQIETGSNSTTGMNFLTKKDFRDMMNNFMQQMNNQQLAGNSDLEHQRKLVKEELLKLLSSNSHSRQTSMLRHSSVGEDKIDSHVSVLHIGSTDWNKNDAIYEHQDENDITSSNNMRRSKHSHRSSANSNLQIEVQQHYQTAQTKKILQNLMTPQFELGTENEDSSPPFKHARRQSLEYLRSSLKEFLVETVGQKDGSSQRFADSPQNIQAAADFIVDSFIKHQLQKQNSSQKKKVREQSRNSPSKHHQTQPVTQKTNYMEDHIQNGPQFAEGTSGKVALNLSKHIKSTDQRLIESAQSNTNLGTVSSQQRSSPYYPYGKHPLRQKSKQSLTRNQGQLHTNNGQCFVSSDHARINSNNTSNNADEKQTYKDSLGESIPHNEGSMQSDNCVPQLSLSQLVASTSNAHQVSRASNWRKTSDSHKPTQNSGSLAAGYLNANGAERKGSTDESSYYFQPVEPHVTDSDGYMQSRQYEIRNDGSQGFSGENLDPIATSEFGQNRQIEVLDQQADDQVYYQTQLEMYKKRIHIPSSDISQNNSLIPSPRHNVTMSPDTEDFLPPRGAGPVNQIGIGLAQQTSFGFNNGINIQQYPSSRGGSGNANFKERLMLKGSGRFDKYRSDSNSKRQDECSEVQGSDNEQNSTFEKNYNQQVKLAEQRVLEIEKYQMHGRSGTAYASSRDESPLLSIMATTPANFAPLPEELQSSGKKSDYQEAQQHPPIRFFDAVAQNQEVISEEEFSSDEGGNESELANAAEGYQIATTGTYHDDQNTVNEMQNSSIQISQGSNRKHHERLDIHYRTGIEGLSSTKKRQTWKGSLKSETMRKHSSQSPDLNSNQRVRNCRPGLQHSFAKNQSSRMEPTEKKNFAHNIYKSMDGNFVVNESIGDCMSQERLQVKDKASDNESRGLTRFGFNRSKSNMSKSANSLSNDGSKYSNSRLSRVSFKKKTNTSMNKSPIIANVIKNEQGLGKSPETLHASQTKYSPLQLQSNMSQESSNLRQGGYHHQQESKVSRFTSPAIDSPLTVDREERLSFGQQNSQKSSKQFEGTGLQVRQAAQINVAGPSKAFNYRQQHQ